MNASADPDRGTAALRHQVRGSSLLLLGRFCSIGINFAVQVAIVRLLSKTDFGAFAYGLAIVLAGELLVKLGIGAGAKRFMPLYYERGARAELIGLLLLVTGTVLVLGALGYGGLLLLAALGWDGLPAGNGARVVCILALLAPVQALDSLGIQLLGSISNPRAILFRKYLAAPLLRLLAVVLAYASGADVTVLAGAYLASGIIGLLLCIHLVVRDLRRQGVLPLDGNRPVIEWRPVLNHSLPLVSGDLLFIVTTAVSSVGLQLVGSESDVAAMRAVVPVATLVLLALQTFQLLFMATAIRTHYEGDDRALAEHQWRSVLWVATLSFPIFVAATALAPWLVPWLFGSQYQEAALLLAILAAGQYLVVCLAFNTESLQILGRTQAIFWVNAVSILLCLALAAWLCPRFGAIGAAIAISSARGFGALFRQWILTRESAFREVPGFLWTLWGQAAAFGAIAVAVGWLWQPPVLIQLVIVAALALLLLRISTRTLDPLQVFPELARIPIVNRFVHR